MTTTTAPNPVGRRRLEEATRETAAARWRAALRATASAAQHDCQQAWTALVETLAAGGADMFSEWGRYERVVGGAVPVIEAAHRGGGTPVPYALAAGHRDRRTLRQAIDEAAQRTSNRVRAEAAGDVVQNLERQRHQFEDEAVEALPADAEQPIRYWYRVTAKRGRPEYAQVLRTLRDTDSDNAREFPGLVFGVYDGADEGVLFSLSQTDNVEEIDEATARDLISQAETAS